MHIPAEFGFYAILTSPRLGYERCTSMLVDGGVAFVQLRIKDRPVREILPIAHLMRKITLGTATKLIINDFPELARECGADGVHVGQTDMNYAEVRAIVGPDAIVGISTHSSAQMNAACALQPDYIGIGPVFPTPTKKNHDPAIGIDGMKKMLAEATVPAVTIGGIDLTNLRSILEAGAKNFCMVRQFEQSDNPLLIINEIGRIMNMRR